MDARAKSHADAADSLAADLTRLRAEVDELRTAASGTGPGTNLDTARLIQEAEVERLRAEVDALRHAGAGAATPSADAREVAAGLEAEVVRLRQELADWQAVAALREEVEALEAESAAAKAAGQSGGGDGPMSAEAAAEAERETLIQRADAARAQLHLVKVTQERLQATTDEARRDLDACLAELAEARERVAAMEANRSQVEADLQTARASVAAASAEPRGPLEAPAGEGRAEAPGGRAGDGAAGDAEPIGEPPTQGANGHVVPVPAPAAAQAPTANKRSLTSSVTHATFFDETSFDGAKATVASGATAEATEGSTLDTAVPLAESLVTDFDTGLDTAFADEALNDGAFAADETRPQVTFDDFKQSFGGNAASFSAFAADESGVAAFGGSDVGFGFGDGSDGAAPGPEVAFGSGTAAFETPGFGGGLGFGEDSNSGFGDQAAFGDPGAGFGAFANSGASAGFAESFAGGGAGAESRATAEPLAKSVAATAAAAPVPAPLASDGDKAEEKGGGEQPGDETAGKVAAVKVCPLYGCTPARRSPRGFVRPSPRRDVRCPPHPPPPPLPFSPPAGRRRQRG